MSAPAASTPRTAPLAAQPQAAAAKRPVKTGWYRRSWRLFIHIFRRPWITEGLLWLLSSLLCAAIALVLALYDGESYDRWHSSISLNALVSVFVTLLYIFLSIAISMCVSQLKWNNFSRARPIYDVELFDQATVSVFGSLVLFVRRPKNLIAAFAAVLFIAVTAVGPFVQQIIAFDFVPQPVGSALLPIATVPIASPDSVNVAGTYILAAEAFTSPLNTSYDVAPTIPPNANCTWDPYYSLVIKNECRNITTAITMNTSCKSIPDGLNCTVPAVCNAATQDIDGHYIRECVSNGEDLRISYEVSGVTVNANKSVYWNDKGIWEFNSEEGADHNMSTDTLKPGPTFRDKGNTLVDFTYLSSSLGNPFSGGPSTLDGGTLNIEPRAANISAAINLILSPQAIAFECNIRIVAQKMQATFANGVLDEVEIGDPVENNSAVAFRDYGFETGYPVFKHCIQFAVPASFPALYACYPSQGPAMLQNFALDFSGYFASGSQLWELLGQDTTRFLTNDGTICSFQQKIEQAVGSFARIMTRFMRTNQVPINESHMDWRDLSVSDYSTTVNNSYGSVSPPNFAYGSATRDTLAYHILWGWIALPAALVLLVGLVILLTIFDTRRKNVPSWGRSTLANVLHAADEETRRLLLDAEEAGSVSEVASTMQVRLSNGARQLSPGGQSVPQSATTLVMVQTATAAATAAPAPPQTVAVGGNVSPPPSCSASHGSGSRSSVRSSSSRATRTPP